MDKQGEIPCAACQSWRKKEKKFSCNPDSCSALTKWLFKNAPQVQPQDVHMQVDMPETVIQYIV